MSGPINRYAYAIALLGGAAGVGILNGVVSFRSSPLLITALAGAAFTAAIIGLIRAADRPEISPTPSPERRVPVEVPTQTPEDAYREFGGGERSADRVADRHGLRAIARETLVRYAGVDAETATRALDAGSWTDDPAVGAYLAGEAAARTDSPSSLLDRLRGTRRTTRARTKTIREIALIPGLQRLDTAAFADPAGDAGAADSETDTRTRTTDKRLTAPESPGRIETGHWWGVGSVALAAIGAGALLESPGLLLAGAGAIGYAGFARSSSVPDPTIAVERTVDPAEPAPGESVTVRTTITNDGSRPLFDCRVVDGVPGALSVIDGTCRVGTALFPGDSVTLEYAVEARPGSHEFDPVLVILGDTSRSAERTVLVPASTAVTCTPSRSRPASTAPHHRSTLRRTGHLRTDDGGSGTDFHSIREYQTGDPINRIDWNRRARTGELATIQFHKMQATRVLLVVDARRAAYAAPTETATHAVDRSVDAAGRIAADALASGDSVGLTAIGPTSRRDGGTDAAPSTVQEPCWIPPASGRDHRHRIYRALATHPQFSTVPAPDTQVWISHLSGIKRQLSGDMELVFLTPLTDFGSALIARRLASPGRRVTVISPDPTDADTPERLLASHCRRLRTSALRRRGISIIDWSTDESLDVVLEREAKRRPGR